MQVGPFVVAFAGAVVAVVVVAAAFAVVLLAAAFAVVLLAAAGFKDLEVCVSVLADQTVVAGMLVCIDLKPGFLNRILQVVKQQSGEVIDTFVTPYTFQI